MTNQNPTLTAANIRYLLVIRELDAEKRGARCIDVAKILGVTKPSVTTMSILVLNLRKIQCALLRLLAFLVLWLVPQKKQPLFS